MGDQDRDDKTSRIAQQKGHETRKANSADEPGRAADAPMTDRQREHLDILADQAGEERKGDLSSGNAEAEIDRLQRKAGQRPAPGVQRG